MLNFPKFFIKVSPLLSFEFFQISGIFPTSFGWFLPANSTEKKTH